MYHWQKWELEFVFKFHSGGTFLVAQWLRICLPMQGAQVQTLVWKIPHIVEQLSPCATTAEPVL